MPAQDPSVSSFSASGPGRPSVRMITSAKGGVGKSTVCANLGMALALRGQRVLLIDADLTNRCLDLMLGMEDRVLYGLSDVLSGSRSASRVILPHPSHPGLRLLPGSLSVPGEMPLCSPAFGSLIESLADGSEDGPYDQILIDLPGGVPEVLTAAAHASDEALVISSAQITAIRSAEHTASLLAEAGLPAGRLIINAFMDDAVCRRSAVRRRKQQNDAALQLVSVIDSIALPLLGVIPFDRTVWEKQNKGLLINDASYRGTGFRCAAVNIAARLCHKSVPLFSDEPEKHTPVV